MRSKDTIVAQDKPSESKRTRGLRFLDDLEKRQDELKERLRTESRSSKLARQEYDIRFIKKRLEQQEQEAAFPMKMTSPHL